MGGSGPHLIHDSVGQSKPTVQTAGIMIGSAVFSLVTAECPYTLQWVTPSPLKTAPYHAGSGPQSFTWFLGSIRVLNPNGISIDSAFLHGSVD